jgi:Matrixin
MRDGGALIATAGPAAGRMDLVTVLVHEMGHAIGLGHSDGGVMDGRLTAGHRAAPDLGGQAAALDAAPAAPRGVSGAAAEAARPAIDWSLPASTAATDRGVASQRHAEAAGGWQQRFVNHLGASAELSRPNAGQRLHLPVVAEAQPRLSRV